MAFDCGPAFRWLFLRAPGREEGEIIIGDAATDQ